MTNHHDTESAKPTSLVNGLRNMELEQRLSAIAESAALDPSSRKALAGQGALPARVANGMIENVIGTFELPLGVATNFIVNQREYLIPMAVEEPSMVAAASYRVKLARAGGGYTASSTRPIMRAQVQIFGLKDPYAARARLLACQEDLITMANSRDTVLNDLGGGCCDIDIEIFDDSPIGPMVVVHLPVDVRNAMGANTVNTMAEMLALVDPYRAATHNTGIMNGIDPVVVAHR